MQASGIGYNGQDGGGRVPRGVTGGSDRAVDAMRVQLVTDVVVCSHNTCLGMFVSV